MQQSSCGGIFLLGEREWERGRGGRRAVSVDRSSRREKKRDEGETGREAYREREGNRQRDKEKKIGGMQGPFKRKGSEHRHVLSESQGQASADA